MEACAGTNGSPLWNKDSHHRGQPGQPGLGSVGVECGPVFYHIGENDCWQQSINPEATVPCQRVLTE